MPRKPFCFFLITAPCGVWKRVCNGTARGHYPSFEVLQARAADCPPPVENDVVPVVTTPAMSGQGVGTSVQRSARISGSGIGLVAASRAAVVAQVATSPDSLMPSRMAALSTMYASQHVTSSDITPIAAENKNARPTASLNAASMVSPVVVPPIIRTAPRLKKSNLDLNGRLVKKGLLVSWHGYRFHVSKVRMGTCYPVSSPVERRFFDCESVLVSALAWLGSSALSSL